MEYLYYQQRTPQKMTKKDSERNKLYSNVKIQKLDPLSTALDDAGLKGGASKKFKSLKEKMGAKDTVFKSGVKPIPFEPVPYFKAAYKRVMKKNKDK